MGRKENLLIPVVCRGASGCYSLNLHIYIPLKSITEVDLPNPKSKKCETLNLEQGKVVRNE